MILPSSASMHATDGDADERMLILLKPPVSAEGATHMNHHRRSPRVVPFGPSGEDAPGRPPSEFGPRMGKQ